MLKRCSLSASAWVVLSTLAFGCATATRPGAAQNDDVTTRTQVIVVGGGIAGLVAAYELEKKGVSVRVLEAADYWGGKVATADYGNGIRGEYGMQEMWEGNPLLDIARELKLPLDKSVAPHSSVVIEDKLYPYVQDTLEAYFASFLSPEEKKALDDWQKRAQELAHKAHTVGLADPEVKAAQDVSLKKWLLEELKLPVRVAEWIRLTIECELGSDWDDFSALFAVMEFRMFFGEGVPCFHVSGGNSQLMEALAAAVKGPKTLLARVTRIDRTAAADGKTEVRVTYMKDLKAYTVVADQVVLAVPHVRLPEIIIEPPLPKDYWASIDSLGMAHYIVVHFQVEKEARKIWMVDGKDSPFAVLTTGILGVVYGVADPTSPPDEPLENFGLLIYGPEARDWHMEAREKKVKEALDELDKLWPGFSKHVKNAHVYGYHPAAIPTWPAGRSPIDEQSELLRKPVMGLHLAGDWLFNAHSDGAAMSGLHVAKQIAAELAGAPAPEAVTH